MIKWDLNYYGNKTKDSDFSIIMTKHCFQHSAVQQHHHLHHILIYYMKRELSSKHQKGLVLSCTTTYVKKKLNVLQNTLLQVIHLSLWLQTTNYKIKKSGGVKKKVNLPDCYSSLHESSSLRPLLTDLNASWVMNAIF